MKRDLSRVVFASALMLAAAETTSGQLRVVTYNVASVSNCSEAALAEVFAAPQSSSV